MLRGNHECRQMTSYFNFRAECLHKYDQEIYDIFMDSFDQMPVGAVINGKFLAVHGGISPELKSVSAFCPLPKEIFTPRAFSLVGRHQPNRPIQRTAKVRTFLRPSLGGSCGK